MSKCTNAAIMNIFLQNTAMDKNLLIAKWQIDVPFQRLINISLSCHTLTFLRISLESSIRILRCYFFHWESGLFKSLVNLISHFKILHRDARTYHCLELFRLCLVGKSHLLHGLMYDASQGSSPTGMNGSHGMMLLIIEKYRNTISRRNTDTDIFQIGHNSINSLQHHFTDIFRH